MKKWLIVPLLLFTLVGAPSCGSSLKLKNQATASLRTSETTLHDLRVAELTLYNSHAIAAYTAEKHIEFLDNLDKAQVAEQTLAHGLVAWNPDDTNTKPASASDYVRYAQAIVGIAQLTAPTPSATNDFLAAAQRLLTQAQVTLTTINGGK